MDKQVKIKYGYSSGVVSFWVHAPDIDCLTLSSPDNNFLEVVLKREHSFRALWKDREILVLLELGPGSNTCVTNLPALVDSNTLDVLDTDYTFYVKRDQFDVLFDIAESYIDNSQA